MRLRSLLVIILIIIYGCSSTSNSRKNYFEPALSYSKLGLDLGTLAYLYQDIPFHSSKEIKYFVNKIYSVKINENLKDILLSNDGNFHVFIDTDGNVESIFLIKSMNKHIDELLLNRLSNSKFKPLRQNGNPTKYALVITYQIIDNNVLYPIINDVSVDNSIVIMTDSNKDFFPDDALSVGPEMIIQAKPDYPDIARKAEAEGIVVVSVVVDPNGDVVNAEILKSPSPLLNESAINAAFKCKFSPAKKGQKAVSSKVAIPYTYYIDN